MDSGVTQGDHHEVAPLPHAKIQQDTCSVSRVLASLVVAPWPLMETGFLIAPPRPGFWLWVCRYNCRYWLGLVTLLRVRKAPQKQPPHTCLVPTAFGCPSTKLLGKGVQSEAIHLLKVLCANISERII